MTNKADKIDKIFKILFAILFEALLITISGWALDSINTTLPLMLSITIGVIVVLIFGCVAFLIGRYIR